MPEKTLQEDEPSRQSNLTLLSSGLRDRVESLITSLDTVTVDVVSEYQNIKTDVHNEQPDLNLDSLLPREKLAILAKFNRPYENARPHHQYLAGTAWQLDQSSFVTRFGEAAYLNLRILKLLRALSKEDSDFDHIHAQLQEQRGHRLTGALKTRGVRKHIDWQPWEFEQVLQRYRERTDSRTQARSCNPAASKAPVLRSGHDANRDELPPLQDHSSHEVQPVDSPQAQPRSVPRLSSAVQVRRSNDVCTTQVVRGTKRKRFHESGPEESTGRAPKHKVGPEEAEEEALQTPDSPSEDLTSPSIELGRRERVDFKPPESPFLPSDDQLSDLSLPEPASSPFVLIDDCDHKCATTPILSEASHAFAEQLTSHDVERLGPVQQSAKATIQSLMATAATASIIREIIVASIELQSQRQYLRDIETTQKSAERCKGNSQTFLEALEAERTRVAYCVGNVVEGHLEWPFSAQHCALALENLDATLRHTSMGIQKLQTFMADLTQKRQQKLRENRGAIARMEAANRKLEDLAPA
ncbi:hypothetical protein C1H76_2679 [Elsinoe australis]|uniref:Uncharacterized protein n=1 Tax=Elsinoe australis TaxID=40998 RepID=A0A4U7B1S9_9PEZI|nr:hypothetical protein C1H76_2679 [Elsinoe australis]